MLHSRRKIVQIWSFHLVSNEGKIARTRQAWPPEPPQTPIHLFLSIYRSSELSFFVLESWPTPFQFKNATRSWCPFEPLSTIYMESRATRPHFPTLSYFPLYFRIVSIIRNCMNLFGNIVEVAYWGLICVGLIIDTTTCTLQDARISVHWSKILERVYAFQALGRRCLF